MADAQDQHDQLAAPHGIDDAIVADTDAPKIVGAAQFDNAVRQRIFRQIFNCSDNALLLRAIQLANVTCRRRLDDDAVTFPGHGYSPSSALS